MKKIPTYLLQEDFSKKLDVFTDRFLADGFAQFEQEFGGIDRFVAEALCDTSERTDHQLRRNEKERYLLEMVSYKIYDRLNRDAFNKKKNTLIIIPDCLSIHDYECQKSDVKLGAICKGCHPDCLAYQVTELGVEYNATVLFSKKSLSEQLNYYANKKSDTSVIGIACIMMLAKGMRVGYELEIPTRGILLQNTGCEHWNDEPFDSQFNINELEEILKEKYGSRN